VPVPSIKKRKKKEEPRTSLSFHALLLGYIYTITPLIIIDALWLGVIAKKFYLTHIGYLMTSNPNWIAISLFYLLYPVGIMIFVLEPSKGNMKKTAILGSLFGFFTYATYELTNRGVIFQWPWTVVIIDILWGVVLTATVSTLAVYFFQKKHT